MKKLLLSLLTLHLLALGLSAQNNKALQQAFSESYAFESSPAYDKAIQALEAVYQADFYPANLRLGWLYYLKGDFYRARDYYQRAMKLLPYAIEPKFGYALTVTAMGNFNEAVSTYEAILHIAPQNTMAHYRLGALYYEQQQYEKAFHHAEIVVNLFPFDYDGVVLFAWTNLKTGKRSQAQALFEKALLIYPNGESALEGLKALE